MKPSRILLVRHGQSTSNADKNVHSHTPDYKIPLTELGQEQARIAGSKMYSQLDYCLDTPWVRAKVAFYVSPYLRTIQTYDEIRKSFPDNKVWKKYTDPRLREQEWGRLISAEESHAIDKEREEYGHFYYRINHGESGADVYDRCTGFLDTLYRDFEKQDFPDNVIIVTHGYTLRILLMRWLHWDVEYFHSTVNPGNCEHFTLALNSSTKYSLATPFPTK